MTDIQPIPQTFPLVDKDGFYTVYFKRFLDQLLQRVLGITGGSYTVLPVDSGSGAALWDLNLKPNVVITLNRAVTTINSINQVAGAPPYRITLVQDSVGGRLVTWGGEFKFPSAVAPLLSVGANAVDDLVFASDGTNMKFQYGVKDIR